MGDETDLIATQPAAATVELSGTSVGVPPAVALSADDEQDTLAQAEVRRLHDVYRDCLLSRKYYALKLHRWKSIALAADLSTALATSSSIAGLSLVAAGPGLVIFRTLGSLSVIVTVIRSVVKVQDFVDRYARLHQGYTELGLDIEFLIAALRRGTSLSEDVIKQAQLLAQRARQLTLQDDPTVNRKLLNRFQQEVEREVPAEGLWMPHY